MKKILILGFFLLLVTSLLVVSYQSKFVDLRPAILDEGRVFETLYAEPYNNGSILIAVEESDREYFYFKRTNRAFLSSMEDWQGYPPKRFKIRFGKVYPLEWSANWGSQKIVP